MQDKESGPNSDIAISWLLTLGSVYKEAEDFSKAIRTFDTADKRLKACAKPDPVLVSMLQLHRAECLRRMKKYAEAEVIYRKLNQDLESPAVVSNIDASIKFSNHAGLAVIESARGDLAGALKESDKMMELLKAGKIPMLSQASFFSSKK